jgi:ABC-type phosphate transport system substrate-binding protein
MLRFGIRCLALILLVAPLGLARDLAVIVDKGNDSSKVTAAELEKLLKVVQQEWPNGMKVKVILSDPTSSDASVILQRVYKMPPEKIKSFLDAHKADIQIAGSDELVLKLVASTPGAIGIVNVYSINSSVKVLKVDDKLPLEPGYVLHGN